MEFNIEYVRTKFDSRLIGLEDVSKVQIKHFSRIREEFRELDTKITGIEAGSLKKQDLESYVRLLAEHLDVHFAAYTLKNQKNNPHFCRFGCCRLAHNLDYNKIQYVLDNTENLNKLMKYQNQKE